jgi:hypothetical protein
MLSTSPAMSIARWRAFGRDRLYVARAEGTKIGYWDLVADEPHPATPELQDDLEAAYTAWMRAPEILTRGA